MRHTVLLTEDRNVLLTFGANTAHQCSPASNDEYMFEPYILTKGNWYKEKKEVISRVLCG